MMANLAIDLSSTAFGVQEYAKGSFDPAETAADPGNHNAEVFPGFDQHRLEDGGVDQTPRSWDIRPHGLPSERAPGSRVLLDDAAQA